MFAIAMALALGCALAGPSTDAPSADAPGAASVPVQRLAQWAQNVPGASIENLHRITPLLYRSAQFSQADIEQLRRLGIRTVISFRAFHSDAPVLANSEIASERIPINTWDIHDQDVVAALRILRHAQAQGPVLIHCQHGADRTGLVSALYRVVYQGWTKEQALDEMEHGGYGFSPVWLNIKRYLRTVDVQRLRQQVQDAPDA
jgi:uncharacterized protein (TIGR01244 family)